MYKFNFKSLFTAIVFVLFCGQGFLYSQTFPDIERVMANEEFQKATNLINQKLIEDPKNGYLYYLKGLSLFETEAFSEAKAMFTKGKGYSARSPWNYIGLGASYSRENNFEEAHAALTRAGELNKTKDSKLLIEVANSYLKSSKTDFLKEAEVILYRIKSLEPKNVEAYIALGDMYLQQGVSELALSNYNKAIELKPDYMKGWLRVGQLNVKDEKFQEGADAFMEAIKINPEFAPSYKELGELWYKAGKYENAKTNYEKYVNLTEGDLSAQLRYGSFLYLTKNYDEGIVQMEKVLKDTTSLVLLRLLGYSYAEKEDVEKAKSYLNQYFAKVKPEDIIAKDYECKATIAKLEGDQKVQFANYEKVIELDDSRTDLYATMGDIKFKEKDYLKAADYFKKSIDSKGAKFKQYFYYGLSHYIGGDSSVADTAFGTIIERYPTIHIGYLYKARLKAKMDTDSKLGLSKPFYEEVNKQLLAKDKLNGQNTKDLIEASQYLGFYYYSHGEDCVNALPYWEKVKELDPENKGANEIIEYCNSK